MRKTISIIELDYHPEVLKYLIEIITDLSEFNFRIFTTEDILRKTGFSKHALADHIACYLQTKDISKLAFVKAHLEFINQADLVYFNTLVADANIYLQHQIKSKKCLRIHNANAYLEQKPSYSFVMDPLIWYKDLSYFVRKVIGASEIKHRNTLLPSFDYFVFPSDRTLEYALEHYKHASSKIYPHSLPIVFHDFGKAALIHPEKTVISVIGTVDRRRRNYQLVIDTIKKISKSPHSLLEFHFLGKPAGANGRRIIQALQKLSSPTVKISTYEGFVENSLFEGVIQATDFILIPLNIRTRFTLFEEVYGETKISGNVNDAIRYGKKAIINADYKLDKEIASSMIHFKNEDDLAKILSNIESYKDILPNYTHFDKKNVVDKYRNAFHQMSN